MTTDFPFDEHLRFTPADDETARARPPARLDRDHVVVVRGARPRAGGVALRADAAERGLLERGRVRVRRVGLAAVGVAVLRVPHPPAAARAPRPPLGHVLQRRVGPHGGAGPGLRPRLPLPRPGRLRRRPPLRGDLAAGAAPPGRAAVHRLVALRPARTRHRRAAAPRRARARRLPLGARPVVGSPPGAARPAHALQLLLRRGVARRGVPRLLSAADPPRRDRGAAERLPRA